jgi:hypothetical protein
MALYSCTSLSAAGEFPLSSVRASALAGNAASARALANIPASAVIFTRGEGLVLLFTEYADFIPRQIHPKRYRTSITPSRGEVELSPDRIGVEVPSQGGDGCNALRVDAGFSFGVAGMAQLQVSAGYPGIGNFRVFQAQIHQGHVGG